MNYYVDLYANLLPGLPAAETAALSEEQAEQRTALLRDSNVKIAVCAPLFDAQAGDISAFLSARDEKMASLSESAQPMRLTGGAVVSLERCLAHPRDLKPLAIGGSSYLLIDLPRVPVTEALCEQLARLHIVSGLSLIAADIDRHFDARSPEDWMALRDAGLLLQISAAGVMSTEHRKLSLFLLANHFAQFVASGACGPENPPRFSEAMRLIQRSLPALVYRRIKNNAGMLLSDAAPSEFQ